MVEVVWELSVVWPEDQRAAAAVVVEANVLATGPGGTMVLSEVVQLVVREHVAPPLVLDAALTPGFVSRYPPLCLAVPLGGSWSQLRALVL